MALPARDLDAFDEDIAFQRTFWRIERIAWIAFAALIVLALAGFTGAGGPLAHATVATPYGALEHPRISRWQTADDMIVTIARTDAAQARVELDRRFVENFEIVSIHPQPRAAAAAPGGMRYAFDLEGGGEIVFQLRAKRPAFQPRGSVRVNGVETPVHPLILP